MRQGYFDVQTQNSFIQNTPPTTLFRPGEQAAFLESFSESNQRLAQQYLGRENGQLFLDMEVKDLPQYQVNNEELLRDSIIYFGRTIQILEEQNVLMRKKYNAATKEALQDAINYFDKEIQTLTEQNLALKEQINSLRKNINKQVNSTLIKEIDKMKNSSAMYQWLKKCYNIKKKFVKK